MQIFSKKTLFMSYLTAVRMLVRVLRDIHNCYFLAGTAAYTFILKKSVFMQV